MATLSSLMPAPARDDSDIVLRSVAPGTPGARTVSFVEFVDTPLHSLDSATVQGYAECRALLEGGFPLVPSMEGTSTSSPLQKASSAAGKRQSPTAVVVPKSSYHQQQEFSNAPRWRSLAKIFSEPSYEAEGEERNRITSLPTFATKAFSRNVDPVTARKMRRDQRTNLLQKAAERMGLREAPLISPTHLLYHGFLVDRALFEKDIEASTDGTTAGSAIFLQTSENITIHASNDGAEEQAKNLALNCHRDDSADEGTGFDTMLSPKTNSKHQALKRLREVAARERRLGSANRWAAFDPHAEPRPDIGGAALFEWMRYKSKEATSLSSKKKRQDSPVASGAGSPMSSPTAINKSTSKIQLPSEEFWISLKGVVFRIDMDDVHPGRRLYYRMVLVPLYSGKDCTEVFAKMVRPAEITSLDDLEHIVQAEREQEDDLDRNFGELDDEHIGQTSLARLWQKMPHRAPIALTAAERQHVDRIFALFVHDFRVVGALGDKAFDFWW